MKKTLVLSAALLCASMAFAHPHHHPEGEKQPPKAEMEAKMEKDMKARMVEDLGLTEEQAQQMQVLHESKKEERKAQFEEMKSIKEQQQAEILKEKPNAKVLADLNKKLSALQAKMNDAVTAHLLEVKKVLNAEQFEKMLKNADKKRPAPQGPKDGKKCDGPKDGEKCNHHQHGKGKPAPAPAE